jgi:hypothetical protein
MFPFFVLCYNDSTGNPWHSGGEGWGGSIINDQAQHTPSQALTGFAGPLIGPTSTGPQVWIDPRFCSAGFGKTTLLGEWARQTRFHAAWVSLDERDNDPVRFWDYFISALQALQPSLGVNALVILHADPAFISQISPIESALTILINDLVNLTDDIIVILDDYHLVESKQVHDGVTYLLEHMPIGINSIYIGDFMT